MSEIESLIKKIPLVVKIVLCICCPALLAVWAIFGFIKPLFSFAVKEGKAFSDLVNNPSKENAEIYIEIMRNKPIATLAPDNNPNAWAVLREKWYIINRSDKVPTHMKKEIFDILVNKGLYVGNSKIIDNYKNTDANIE